MTDLLRYTKNPEPEDVKKAADDDQRFWSVTTIIGTLDKPALVYWAADMTARAAIDDDIKALAKATKVAAKSAPKPTNP